MRTVVSIQALRAIAALSVVLCHCFKYYGQAINGSPIGQWDRLGSGVDLFFVISGFVMVYGPLFGAQGGPLTFMRHRLARIVPLYWAATTIWLLLGQPFHTTELLGSYFFIPYPSFGFNPLYGVGWTLNFEMLFYTVFSVCLLFRKAQALVGRVVHSAGYNLLSLTRASAVVNCQFALACFLLRSASHASTSSFNTR